MNEWEDIILKLIVKPKTFERVLYTADLQKEERIYRKIYKLSKEEILSIITDQKNTLLKKLNEQLAVKENESELNLNNTNNLQENDKRSKCIEKVN